MPTNETPVATAKRKPPLRMNVVLPVDPLEDWHQREVITMAALHEKEWPELSWVYHVPNGGLRDDGVGEKLKQQGVRAGVEDLALDVPRRDPKTGGVYMGWRGELKRERSGKPSPEQEDWLAFHRSQGYRAEWHSGWKALWADLLWYLNLPRVCPAPAPRPFRWKPPKPKVARKPRANSKQARLLLPD